TAVRTPLASRFNRISLAHWAVDFAPPTVRAIEGSFKLSKIAVRKELRNCSLTVTVASAGSEILVARRPRVAVVCCAAINVKQIIKTINEAKSFSPLVSIKVLSEFVTLRFAVVTTRCAQYRAGESDRRKPRRRPLPAVR